MLSFTIGKSSISIFFEGDFFSIDDSHANFAPLYDELRKPIECRDMDAIRGLVSIKRMIELMTVGRVTITDVEVLFEGSRIGNYMAERMIELMHDGIDIEPYAAFMNNVMDNPAVYTHDELYQWMEKAKLPITPDGHFLAFKKVRNDYTDCHTGRFSNAPGTTLEMDRTACDTNRHNHCSSGFHFCSPGYLSSFGGQRVVVVKINPRDVTSIPSDYKFTKGRTCRYEVVAELTSQSAAYDSFWKPGVVTLENPAEFPASIVATIVLPSPALNEPVTVQAESDPTTREAWERIDSEGSAAAVSSGLMTSEQRDQYMLDCKLRYDTIFDDGGELIKPDATRDEATHIAATEAVFAALEAESTDALPTIERVGQTQTVVAAETAKSWTAGLLELEAAYTSVFETTDGRQFSPDLIKQALADASIRGAARDLGVGESTLRGWKKRLGL